MKDLIVLLKVLDLLHDFFENFGAVLCSAFHSDCDPKGTHCCGKQCRRIYICLFCVAKRCWGMPQAPLICIFQCRLRIPSGRFLPRDVLWVVQNLHEVRSGFCKRIVLHLFRNRRIQKRNAPFLHTFRKLLLRQQCSLPAH